MRASVDLLSIAGGWEVLSSKQPHTHTDLGLTPATPDPGHGALYPSPPQTPHPPPCRAGSYPSLLICLHPWPTPQPPQRDSLLTPHPPLLSAGHGPAYPEPCSSLGLSHLLCEMGV